MVHRLVVARWDEDVRWAADYPHIIYNKRGEPLIVNDLNVIPLDVNPEGHESHTYLHHIISHYDELDDWTTFCQGNPFDHASRWETQWKFEPENGFAWVGHWLVTDDKNGKPNHINIIPVGAAYTAIFGRPAPEDFTFIAGAQFVASRELIQRKPVGFYERVQALGYDPKFETEWGYTMERLWGYILTEAVADA